MGIQHSQTSKERLMGNCMHTREAPAESGKTEGRKQVQCDTSHLLNIRGILLYTARYELGPYRVSVYERLVYYSYGSK
jgi:hypothetical protein